MNTIMNFLRLPSEVTDFERNYLTRMNRIAFWFFVGHLPIFMILAAFNQTGVMLAGVLTSAVLCGPALAMRYVKSKRVISVVMGFTAMLMGGLLVHFVQGPIQIEMHFYFFVLLALLAVFANPMVILVAAVTVAAHHALLWFLIPQSVFNYDAPLWVVAVHALFVILESVAACFIARSFFDNVVELEKKVAERTHEIELRNRDMRRLLDTAQQGFFTLDSNGVISAERSAIFDQWLGVPAADTTFCEHVRPHDKKFSDWFELGLVEVFESIMPLEVTLDQLPVRLTSSDRVFECQYFPVMQDEELIALAVSISDVTTEVAREQLKAENREMMAIVEAVSEDKAGFLEFIRETNHLLDGLRRTDCLEELKRHVHTLKGNAGIFGLERVAEICNQWEDDISEQNQRPGDSLWHLLFKRWENVENYLTRVIGEHETEFAVTQKQYDRLLDKILDCDPHDEIAVQLASWQLEPTAKRFSRIGDQIQNLSQRLGKGEISIVTNTNGLHLEAEQWSCFWSTFIHVIRNAVDHGLETPAERLASGKPDRGTITLTSKIENDQFVLSISDDGRGIDWDAIAEKARQLGLPFESQTDLYESIFADGLSTAEMISATSGRGVGMQAVRDACEELGGRIEIKSIKNVGTEFRFFFPVGSMAPSTLECLGSHSLEDPERTLCTHYSNDPDQQIDSISVTPQTR